MSHLSAVAEPTVTIEGPRVTVSFTRKVGLPEYSNVEAAVFYTAPVEHGASLAEVAEAIVAAFGPIKVAVLDELGIESSVDDSGIVREAHTPYVSGAQAKQAVVRKFPGAVDTTATDTFGGTPDAVRIVGRANGPLPTWVIDEAKSRGVAKLYDNRNPDGTAALGRNGKNRPMFVNADNKDDVFWGPR